MTFRPTHPPTILSLLAFGMVLIISLPLHLLFAGMPEDDAYIHMRVARHLWQFGLPYFNLDSAVMASTSPVWILITAPLSALKIGQPTAVAILNSVLISLAACMWGTLFQRAFGKSLLLPLVLGVAISWATLLPSSLFLMETPLALALIAVAISAATRPSPVWAALCGILPFVRPEGAIYAIAIAVWRVCSKRRLSLAEVLCGVIPVVFFLGAELSFFGSIYPHTAHAKELVYSLNLGSFVQSFMAAAYGQWVATKVLPLMIVLVMGGVVWAIASSKKIHSTITDASLKLFLVCAVAPAMMIASFYAMKCVFVFTWYVPLVLLPLHLGLAAIVYRGVGIVRWTAFIAIIPMIGVTAGILLGALFPWQHPSIESLGRAYQLRQIGSALQNDYPSATLMAPEIGALGYEFLGSIKDGVGLASPEALAFHPMKVPEQRHSGGVGSIPLAYAEQENPDIIVGFPTMLFEVRRSTFASRYQEYRIPPLPSSLLPYMSTVWGNSYISVMIRNDLPVPQRLAKLAIPAE